MLLVAGIVNIETSVRVGEFPVAYAKSRFAFHGVTDRLGGVGHNVAVTAAGLGQPVRLATMIGKDVAGEAIAARLKGIQCLDTRAIVQTKAPTPRSTILVDDDGRGAMFTDLKDAQEATFPTARLDEALNDVRHVHATNINWALRFAKKARRRRLSVSTDVQALSDLEGDTYNRRFLDVADIVFLSAENLALPPAEAAERLLALHPAELVICTAGADGVWAAQRSGRTIHQPARPIERIANATGAGDAFAAGFLKGLLYGCDLNLSLALGQQAAIDRIAVPRKRQR
ncbi:MAG: carbohydrate kinase family protein [Candidatus Sumerlaeia bacterium]|nr:carbohydrate kinase family protein [Candidatus Sumerlaeia bacterium]